MVVLVRFQEGSLFVVWVISNILLQAAHNLEAIREPDQLTQASGHCSVKRRKT
jgi:hypothetical protein